MAAQTYQLVIQKGLTPGKVFELIQDELTIGRDITNRIVLNDPEVSRKHAHLKLQSGSYVIEDLGSTNGTFVDGQRLIGPHLLRPGEIIMLGEKIQLVYEGVGFDPNATIVSPVATARPLAPPETQRAEQPAYGYQPEPPAQPGYYQPQPAFQPQQAYQPQSAPVYSGNVPPGPADVYAAPGEMYAEFIEEEPPRKSRTTMFIVLAIFLVMILCLVVFGFIFDFLNLYCTPPFSSLFACP
jgi:predicted component of type VI protein secretion system